VIRRLPAVLALWLGLWALAAALLAWPVRAQAQDVLPVPALSARVIDQTGTLAPDAVAAMEAKLAAFEKEAGSQVVVLMLPTTQPEDIAAYAQRVGDAWKIGRRDVGDGLLIVVALNDRRINIQTTKALEGAIPDLAARQIIDRVVKPAFRAGDYAGGLNAALDQLFARIRGESLPLPGGQAEGGERGSRGPALDQLLIFFFVGVSVVGTIFTRIFGRKLGALVTGGAAGGVGWLLSSSVLIGLAAGVVALVLIGVFGLGAARRGISRGGRAGVPPIIWGGGGDHGGWGGGGWGGGGGFSSGGGGDFGGGGASGDW